MVFLRTRDIVAGIAAVILTRVAWEYDGENVRATVHLAYYLPFQDQVLPVPFDTDGDGTHETLAMIKSQKNADNRKKTWLLQILDLHRLHQNGKELLAPFQPKPMLISDQLLASNSKDAVPLQLVTGQVLGAIKQPPKKEGEDTGADRTRHYFCGKDWHDASVRCGTPCPSGTITDCPGDEKCYADTPCDSNYHDNRAPDKVVLDGSLHLTPAGGLPSVFTLWSHGVVTMHSLTGDAHAKKKKGDALELREMWTSDISEYLKSKDGFQRLTSSEIDLQFLDAYDSIEEAGNGMLIITRDAVEDTGYVILALDAMHGKLIWQVSDPLQEEEEEPLFPISGNAQLSSARRRSRIGEVLQSMSEDPRLPNCLLGYQNSLLHSDAFPFGWWTHSDSKVRPMHLDHRKHKSSSHQQDHVTSYSRRVVAKEDVVVDSTKGSHALKNEHKKKRHGKRKMVRQGSPNVLVKYHQGGLLVHALRSGQPLCHLSLEEETMYADVQRDGILDSVRTQFDSKASFDEKLKDQLSLGMINKPTGGLSVCQASATSGLPAKKNIFSVSLCSTEEIRDAHAMSTNLLAAPPLVVESMYEENGHKERDVVFALNNHVLTRIRSKGGYRQWKISGKKKTDFPAWGEKSMANGSVLLTRVESDLLPKSFRPILLVGESSMAIFSVKTGEMLAAAKIPQRPIAPPILADLSGDTTQDVLVATSDAVWGYQIIVRTGASVFWRMVVAFLYFAVLLAVLRNRFGQRTNRRSTDE